MDWITKLFISSFFYLYLPYFTSCEIILALNYDNKPYKFLNYELINKLECNIFSEIPSTLELKWFKDDELFEPIESRFEKKGHQLIIKRTEESDLADYVCALVEKDDPKKIIYRSESMTCLGKPTSKIVVVAPTSNPVDEGGKIKLECVVQGKPTPKIYWRKDDYLLETDDRIEIINSVIGGDVVLHTYLEIKNVEMSDTGHYYCKAQNQVNRYINDADAVIFIRVVDKLAGLWPFIGICCTVLVLSTIIFYCESKHKKVKLCKSNISWSPLQKNTLNQRKDTV